MPRSVRDSDEDMETRTGRKTRIGSGVPESPIRRSTRNKQSTKQNDSFSDLSVIETNSTQTNRNFRKRAGTVDTNSLEVQRSLRSTRNAMDMNKTKDSEGSVEVQPKKITRRSLAATNAPDTPKSNILTRRLTRAGSETKSVPVGRITRKTRASSMDPEPTIELTHKEKNDTEEIGTPSRIKRRASILPTNTPVIEEEEKVLRITLEDVLMEENESYTSQSLKAAQVSDDVQKSPEKESNEENENVKKAEEKDCSVEGPIDHSSKNDHMEISDNIISEEPINETKSLISDPNNIQGKDRDSTTNIEVTLTKDEIHNVSTDISHNIVNLSKEVESKDENILHVSLEEGELNTSNKENECLNISNPMSNNKQTKNESILNVSIEEGEINTSNKENECLNVDNSVSEQNKNISNIKKLNQDDSIAVLDSSTKEDKSAHWNDKKLDNVSLKECSESVLNSDNSIPSSNANNETQDNLHKENISASTLSTEEASFNVEVDHNDTQMSNDKISDIQTVPHNVLNEEDTILKEQSKLDEISNNPKEDKTLEEEEVNKETVSQDINNITEIHSIAEIEQEVNVSLNSSVSLNVSVSSKENLDTSVKEDKCITNVEITEISNMNSDSNENQDNMSTSTQNSSTIVLQITDSVSEPSTNTEQTELHSSECLIDLQSVKSPNFILETNDSSTVAESHDVPEEDLPDDKGSTISSLSGTPKTSKIKSITELNKSKTEEEAKKSDIQNVDESDDVSSTGMFQDISADEWKQKHETANVENDTNSVHSTSTVKLENESETECDLVLVDKKAWLAAESLKTAQKKESFEYDSDDTVVLKSKMDYLKDKSNMNNEKQNSSKDKLSLKEDEVKIHKTAESLQNKSKKDKSLNKTEDKQLEEEEELTLTQKETEDHNKSEDKLARSASEKKKKKNRSLNSSLNKKSILKQKPAKRNRLHISSSTSSISSVASTSESENIIKTASSGKKRSSKNYSTMVHIGSDSDSCILDSTDSSDNDTGNNSLRIPLFLFKNKDSQKSDESNEDESSKASIDSDINAEYNLDGKTIGKFSDDDIPGDECRASESESSDPDDNGSDLADFVVDDDEVEEEEEEEDENEDENEEQEEEQEEEEEQEQKQEHEYEHEQEREQEQEQKQEEIEEEDQEKNLNESEKKSFKRKVKSANNSLICSTPKAEVHQHEQYKHNVSSEKKKRKYIEKTSIHNESDKTRSKDLSIDNSDNNKTTLNISANVKKRHSIDRNISADLQELIKDTNIVKPLLFKKTHLNKTLSPSSETPTLKYLRKQKLNESAPLIKLEESKTAIGNASSIDKNKDISTQDESNTVITKKTVDTLQLDSSLSAKRKISTEVTDSDDQTELRHKKEISKIGQVSEVDDKVQVHVEKEKENIECTLNVDDGKKKRKRRNKKKTNSDKEKVVNINTENIEKLIESEEKVIETTSSTESKKNKKNKRRNVENLDKNDDGSSNVMETSSKYVEVKDIPKKKKKNETENIAKVQVKEQSKKLPRQNIMKGTSSNAKLSHDAAESAEFLKLKYEALESAKRAADSIKTNKDMKKDRTKHFENMQQIKEIGKSKIDPVIIPSTRGIKRLSLEVIENLSDASLRPNKKQKISQTPMQATSHIITKGGFRESTITKVRENLVTSNSGSTTDFTIVNLQKAKKQLKKIPAVASFRQKMLSRNSRYPVTSYIMYLQKQKVTARDPTFLKQI